MRYYLPPERWLCTAALAATHALPRKLEDVCTVLDLAKKDMEGHRLMLKMSKPRKPTKLDKRKWHNKKADLIRLVEYCKKDVKAETDVLLTLPPLNPFERKVWVLDQKINARGVLVDRDLVQNIIKMIAKEKIHLNAEAVKLTGGAFRSTTQREAVRKWVAAQGVHLPNMQAKTIDDAIAANLVTGKVKRVLEIRRAISKTSLGKYPAFEMRSRTDGIVRAYLMYWAASTGRWGGVGIQPQNLPRGNFKSFDDYRIALELIQAGNVEMCRMLYGDVMGIFSALLRSMVIARPGKEFFCADFAAIEVRVLFWLADHVKGLEAFRKDKQLYRELAEVIYGIKLKLDEGPEREVGKRAVLGCGFGMGAVKFEATCKQFGQEVSTEIAERAVKAYRKAHAPVVQLWYNVERSAISAVLRPGRVFETNHTKWFVERDFLYCELPSGRRLAYHKPTIKYKKTPWGEKRPTLYHWSVHPKTKKYVNDGTYGGKLTENIVQAMARDLEAESILRIEPAGYDVVLHTHDEILGERKKGEGNVKKFENLMAEIPAWAAGCPVKAKGWSGSRYRK